MFYDEGPVVAINEHSSDPHFDPDISDGREFKVGDWVLIDLWAKRDVMASIFSDITWVGFIGNNLPPVIQEVFDIVINARDIAVLEINKRFEERMPIYGWEVDKIARDYINELGYGDYFTHRLGHSIGSEVHASGVNLDSLETVDKREIIPGIGLTVEPGIYLPEFGVRSEIDIYITEKGAKVTTPVQKSIVIIN
jgi:Xaa-Pro aminopeptidase